MTHASATRIVVDLIPEIEKSGAATVLTDYAAREDLPPAQLEKLAQVFNTLRQVAFIDNASPDERASDGPPLIDIPHLVTSYALGAEREKAAARPDAEESHDPTAVNLALAVRRSLRPQPETVKAAAAPSAPERTVVRVSREQTLDALMEIEIEARDEMSKQASRLMRLASSPERGTLDVSAAETDACYLQPAHLVKAAGEWLDKFAAAHRTTLTHMDFSAELPPRAFDMCSDAGAAMAALAKSAGIYDTVVKMAAGQRPLPAPQDDKLEREEFAFQDIDAPEGQTDAGTDGNTTETTTPPPNITVQPGTRREPSGGGDDKPEEDGRPGGGGKNRGNDGGGGGGGKKGDKKEPGVGGKLEGFLTGIPGNAMAGVRGTAAKADEILGRITTKERQNKAQKNTDMSVADIRRAISLRRMIGSDPVLREADQRDVLDIYNSVVELNPELAGNMPALKLLLREAVSYEGLTLDAQKQLTDIRKNREQGEQAAADNEKRRYAVGGANTISVTTKK